jgi:hypothetical protein
MQYTIAEVTDGVAKIVWSDDSWSFVKLSSDMTEADLDDLVYSAAPGYLMTGEAPSFVAAGSTRTAAAKPVETITIEEEGEETPSWLEARMTAYGTIPEQIEFITENGLDAWQTKVAQIKADNPKPSE